MPVRKEPLTNADITKLVNLWWDPANNGRKVGNVTCSLGWLAADGRPGQHVVTTTGVGHEASGADFRQVGLDTMFKSERILHDK